MPKNPPKNAFFYFMLDYKEKQARTGRVVRSLAEVATLAGPVWKEMGPSQRAPYEDRANNGKMKSKGGKKFSSQGVPLDLIEKQKKDKDLQERLMKKEIEDTVKDCFANDTLANHKFYFVMGNYFAKTIENDYIPAELAVAEYSLKSGVNKKFQTFIDPGTLPIGMGFQAKSHSDDTHRLPTPPNAMGERDFGKVISNLLSFIETDENGQYPPLYTNSFYLEMMTNIMETLQNDYFGNNPVNFRIYPIQYLYFTLKNATAEKGEVKKPESIFISDAIFERDTYEYQDSISCDFHDQIDVGKYCALSCVVRWGFMFSDYMCYDLALDMIPGCHLPPGADISAARKTFSSSNLGFSDSKSYMSLSGRSLSSSMAKQNINQPKIEPDDFDAKSDITHPLGDVRKRGHPPAVVHQNDSSDDEKEDNPWSIRNKNKPRPPKDDSFSFSSVVSGRGRGIKTEPASSNASTISRVSGRGRLFQQ